MEEFPDLALLDPVCARCGLAQDDRRGWWGARASAEGDEPAVYCPDCAQHEWPELFFVQFRAADPSELPKGSEHVWHTWLSAFEDRGDAEASMASLKGGMPRMDYVSARNDPPVRRSLALTYRVVSRSELREEGEDALRRAENDTWRGVSRRGQRVEGHDTPSNTAESGLDTSRALEYDELISALELLEGTHVSLWSGGVLFIHGTLRVEIARRFRIPEGEVLTDELLMSLPRDPPREDDLRLFQIGDEVTLALLPPLFVSARIAENGDYEIETKYASLRVARILQVE